MSKNRNRAKYGMMSIFIVISSFFLTGCWSGTEVDNLAIINIMGIDVNKSGDFELTVRVIKPQEVYRNSPNSGGVGQGYRPEIETGKGKSLVEAMADLSQRVSNRIYLGHVMMVVLSENAARNKLQESLDFLTRENHFRPNIKLLVTEGTAQSILNVKPRLETTLGAEVNSFLQNTKYHPTSMVLDVTKFVEKSVSETSDPYTGVINLDNKENQHSKGRKTSQQKIDDNNDDAKLVFSGTAVFKKNGLMGILDSNETEGFLWVIGKVTNDILVLDCGNGDKGTVSLKISNTQSHMTPKIVNRKPVIDDTIKVNADIRQMTCKSDNLSSKAIEHLNKQLEKHILSEINATMKKVKLDWQADIFGFGNRIYKKYPEVWKDIAPRWTQGELGKLKVNYNIETNISNYGLVKESK